MATTREIGKKLEELLEQQGDGIKVSSGYRDSRFHVQVQRLENGIHYLAGGPKGIYLSIDFEKVKGHWKAMNLNPIDKRDRSLVNKMLNTSYQVLNEALSGQDY